MVTRVQKFGFGFPSSPKFQFGSVVDNYKGLKIIFMSATVIILANYLDTTERRTSNYRVYNSVNMLLLFLNNMSFKRRTETPSRLLCSPRVTTGGSERPAKVKKKKKKKKKAMRLHPGEFRKGLNCYRGLLLNRNCGRRSEYITR